MGNYCEDWCGATDDFSDILFYSKEVMRELWDNKEDEIWDNL